jgi:hypothetical protein
MSQFLHHLAILLHLPVYAGILEGHTCLTPQHLEEVRPVANEGGLIFREEKEKTQKSILRKERDGVGTPPLAADLRIR